MNIYPQLKTTLLFENMKIANDFHIGHYLQKYKLSLESYFNYRDHDLFFMVYIVRGEPKGLIDFLNDEDISSRLF